MGKFSSIAIVCAALFGAALATKYSSCGGKCGGYLPKCEPGTKCHYGVCKAKNLDVGSKCSKCRECKHPLICQYGRCAKKMESPQTCGGKCDTGVYPKACAGGAVCVKKTCKKPSQPLNASCSKACESCKRGLVCKYGRCALKMKSPQRCGGKCNTGVYPNACSGGAICIKNTCKKPSQPLRASCRRSCETCKAGLVCKYGRCAAKLVGCGGSCRGGLKCKKGLRCYGGKCKKVNVGSGGKCSSCKVCRYGYKCVRGRCTKPMSGCGGRCGGYSGLKCQYGLSCSKGRCYKYVGSGSKCGGCLKCKSGYTCNGYLKKCIRRKY